MSSNKDDWGGWPLGHPETLDESKTFTVRLGGPSPTPGSPDAKIRGCLCPGLVGDEVNGRPGYTIDEDCPYHGKKARDGIPKPLMELGEAFLETIAHSDDLSPEVQELFTGAVSGELAHYRSLTKGASFGGPFGVKERYQNAWPHEREKD